MHRSDISNQVNCSDCGAEVSSGRDREYAFGASLTLCFDCALRRGGRYDDTLDRWSPAPSIDDIEPVRD